MAKESPNLAKWLAKNVRTMWGQPLVYRDADGIRWIGWVDDDLWFIGTKLMRVLTVGAKAQVFAHTSLPAGAVEIAGFWDRYEAIGRCAIDEAHQIAFIGDDDRWLVKEDTRHCQWCGAHSQQLRSWVEMVDHSRWETVAPRLTNPTRSEERE